MCVYRTVEDEASGETNTASNVQVGPAVYPRPADGHLLPAGQLPGAVRDACFGHEKEYQVRLLYA